MFQCGKVTTSKPKTRKTSKWRQRASCFHGNKSINVTQHDLQSDFTQSPSKKAKMSVSKTMDDGFYSFEDENKENVSRRMSVNHTLSKNNLYIGSPAQGTGDRSKHSLLSTEVESVYDDIDILTSVTRHASADSGIDTVTQSGTKKCRRQRQSLEEVMSWPQTVLRISKLSCGYGFTIRGTCPVRVGRVKPEGSAAVQGLRAGDVVLSINGRDTENLSVETVAKIVRRSTDPLSLIIARKPEPTEKSLSSTTSSLSDKTDSVLNRAITGSSISSRSSVSQSSLPSVASTWQPDLADIQEETPAKSSKYQKWQPDMSHIDRFDDTARFLDGTDHIYEEISQVTSSTERSSYSSSYQSSNVSSTINTESDLLISESRFQETWTTYSNSTDESSTSRWEPSSASSGDDTYLYGPPNTETSLDDTDRVISRAAAVQQLVDLEQDFCHLMKCGIQRFSRPLRHHLMSRSQHQKLFQNIEKLVALSEFHTVTLTRQPSEDSLLSPRAPGSPPVGAVYRPKVALVCEAYELYSAGLPAAMDLLNAVCADRSLRKLVEQLERTSPELSLAWFLRRPTCHYRQLAAAMSRVLAATSREHPDYGHLTRVVSVLHGSCHPADLTENYDTSSSDLSSLYGNTGSFITTATRRQHRSQSATRSKVASQSATRSKLASQSATRNVSCDYQNLSALQKSQRVNREILELEQRISFPEYVKPFPLAEPCRHVIFSGDLSVSVATHSAPLWAVLCSDLLLLTQRDARGQLKVIDDPIFLQNIAEVNFNCQHPCDFEVASQRSLSSSCHQRSLLSSCGVTRYTLRAPSQEMKYAWRTLLDQRVRASRAQGDSAYCSMDEIV